jgi:hypothetical protein
LAQVLQALFACTDTQTVRAKMADITEINAITGEVITRDYTEAEAEQRAKDLAKHAALKEAEAERVAARQAVLAKLGLSAEEAAALLG